MTTFNDAVRQVAIRTLNVRHLPEASKKTSPENHSPTNVNKSQKSLLDHQQTRGSITFAASNSTIMATIHMNIHRTRSLYRIAASTFFFLQGLTFASWTSRIPDIKRALDLSEADLGSILFGLPMGQLTAMAISGYLVSRFGSKRMLTIAALIYPAALIGLGTVSSGWQLALGLYVFGMTANLINISVNTQGIGVERLYGRTIMPTFHGLWSLAGFTGGIISSFMAGNGVTPFWHFVVIYLVALTILVSMRPMLLPRDATPPKTAERSKRRIFARPDRYIVLLGLTVFGSMICEGTMFDWSGVYFEKVVQPDDKYIRLGYIAYMSTMALGRFSAEWLSKRFGIITLLRSSGLVIATGLLLSVVFPYLATATLGFLLVGLGTSSVVPLCYSLAAKSKTLRPGIAITTVATIGFMGFLIGPPIIGYIAHWSSLQWSFVVIAVIGLTTTLIAPHLQKILKTMA
ncbi:MAG: MFS transporter [Marinilabiliaceae bacterium]|nr:MFS transporter [Marinilabiliaceae bacterium]